MATSSATVAMAGVVPSTTPSLNACSPSSSKFLSLKPALPPVRAGLLQQPDDSVSSRRSLLGLLVAAPSVLLAADALADVASVKVEPPPLPFGGLPGTQNADQPRELELPLKDRFFIQILPPELAVARAKDSAQEIIAVKKLIDRRAWPYVQNDLRSKATCLRYDLNTIISAKPKAEKKAFKTLVAKLFETIDGLDYAARSKSVPKAEKYYSETVAALNAVLSKLG